jgi:hypothetical protein
VPRQQRLAFWQGEVLCQPEWQKQHMPQADLFLLLDLKGLPTLPY